MKYWVRRRAVPAVAAVQIVSPATRGCINIPTVADLQEKVSLKSV